MIQAAALRTFCTGCDIVGRTHMLRSLIYWITSSFWNKYTRPSDNLNMWNASSCLHTITNEEHVSHFLIWHGHQDSKSQHITSQELQFELCPDKHNHLFVPLSLFILAQDSASLKVPSSCTPADLMELALRKWLTTHGPEEEVAKGNYVLRVSHCLEFLCGDHPLSAHKVSDCRVGKVTIRMVFISYQPTWPCKHCLKYCGLVPIIELY